MRVPGSMKGCLCALMSGYSQAYPGNPVLRSPQCPPASTHLSCIRCAPTENPSLWQGLVSPNTVWVSLVPQPEKSRSLSTKQGGAVPWALPTEDKKAIPPSQKNEPLTSSSLWVYRLEPKVGQIPPFPTPLCLHLKSLMNNVTA